MFTNMLRPSRRHAHERISQNEDTNVNVNNDSNNNSDNSNDTTGVVDQSEQPTIVVIEGEEENGIGNNDQHDFNFNNLTEATAATAAADENGESDGASQLPGTARRNVIHASNNQGSSNNSTNSNNSNNISSNNNMNNEPSDTNENQNNENSQPGNNSIAMEESSSSGASIVTEESILEEGGTLHHPDPTATHPFLLTSNHIQNGREIRYSRQSRQSTCTLLIFFFLIRLWVEAIQSKNVGLMFLSMMASTWTYRWFKSWWEAEEAHDLQSSDDERNNTTTTATTTTTTGLLLGLGENNNQEGRRMTMANTGADAAVDFDPDLGLMSFQAQLALSILESQRQMFENGGYGGNDRSNNGTEDGPGVTNEAKEIWKSYEWTSASIIQKSTSIDSNYGSVSTALTEDDDNYNTTIDESNTNNNLDNKTPSSSTTSNMEGGLLEKKKSFDTMVVEEQPSCSICLCEYEPGDKVIRLPCNHVYHESCLNSWTNGHVRCPLCNCDLMEGYEQPPSVQRAQQHAEEQRAFRSMALSTLGRRIRTTRSSGRRTVRSRSTRASTAAALMAAAEDSVV